MDNNSFKKEGLLFFISKQLKPTQWIKLFKLYESLGNPTVWIKYAKYKKLTNSSKSLFIIKYRNYWETHVFVDAV